MSMEVSVLVIQTRCITNVHMVMYVLQTRLHVASQKYITYKLDF